MVFHDATGVEICGGDASDCCASPAARRPYVGDEFREFDLCGDVERVRSKDLPGGGNHKNKVYGTLAKLFGPRVRNENRWDDLPSTHVTTKVDKKFDLCGDVERVRSKDLPGGGNHKNKVYGTLAKLFGPRVRNENRWDDLPSTHVTTRPFPATRRSWAPPPPPPQHHHHHHHHHNQNYHHHQSQYQPPQPKFNCTYIEDVVPRNDALCDSVPDVSSKAAYLRTKIWRRFSLAEATGRSWAPPPPPPPPPVRKPVTVVSQHQQQPPPGSRRTAPKRWQSLTSLGVGVAAAMAAGRRGSRTEQVLEPDAFYSLADYYGGLVVNGGGGGGGRRSGGDPDEDLLDTNDASLLDHSPSEFDTIEWKKKVLTTPGTTTTTTVAAVETRAAVGVVMGSSRLGKPARKPPPPPPPPQTNGGSSGPPVATDVWGKKDEE
ncbi:unnamed protein product, partial [Notodromas monacha]